MGNRHALSKIFISYIVRSYFTDKLETPLHGSLVENAVATCIGGASPSGN
jgi:hypothetical protein